MHVVALCVLWLCGCRSFIKETLGALELACGAINCVLPYPAPSRPTLPFPRRNATGKELPVIEVGALAPKPKKGDVITALWTTGAVGQFQPPARNVTVQVGSALCLAFVCGGTMIERPQSVLIDGQRTVWGFQGGAWWNGNSEGGGDCDPVWGKR